MAPPGFGAGEPSWPNDRRSAGDARPLQVSHQSVRLAEGRDSSPERPHAQSGSKACPPPAGAARADLIRLDAERRTLCLLRARHTVT